MHHILAPVGKICLALCASLTGALTFFTLGASLFFFVRAGAQSAYDQRQDDHMKSIDERDKTTEIERKERRQETLVVRDKQQQEIDELVKLVAAQAPAVAKIDDIHDRQIRDEAYVGGALGIIGVFQFYLNNKDKQLRKSNDKRYTRKPYDEANDEEDR